jgi:hypothetical protein
VHPKGKSFKIVKDIAITDHGGINKTSSTPTTRSSIPTPNSLPPPITAGWHSYANSRYGISLLYPPDWILSSNVIF